MVRANHRERLQRIHLRRVKIHADSLDFSSISDICIRNTSWFQSREDDCMSITMSGHHDAVSSKLHYRAEREKSQDKHRLRWSRDIRNKWQDQPRMANEPFSEQRWQCQRNHRLEKATEHFIELSPYAVDSRQYNTSNPSSYKAHTSPHTFSKENGIFFFNR